MTTANSRIEIYWNYPQIIRHRCMWTLRFLLCLCNRNVSFFKERTELVGIIQTSMCWRRPIQKQYLKHLYLKSDLDLSSLCANNRSIHKNSINVKILISVSFPLLTSARLVFPRITNKVCLIKPLFKAVICHQFCKVCKPMYPQHNMQLLYQKILYWYYQ
jgi:hypothetical protein